VPAAASNTLTRAAIVDLPVAPAQSRMDLIWPWLLVPPVVIALFGAHHILKHEPAGPGYGKVHGPRNARGATKGWN
jgi:hypothetical protein